MSAPSEAGKALEETVDAAAGRAAEYLASLQETDGHWRGELRADATLESDYILFQWWLHAPAGGRWEAEAQGEIGKAARSILERQLPDGGFARFPGGPAEAGASVEAYCALKLAGVRPEDPRMASLRSRVLELGGLEAAGAFVKLKLSLFGLYPREHGSAIPVELAFLPARIFNRIAPWAQAIAIPMAILEAAQVSRAAPEGFDLRELVLPGAAAAPPPAEAWSRRRNGRRTGGRFWRLWERFGPKSIRRKAVERAAAWMTERLEGSEGLAAIYPATMYAVMALDALGYPADHPLRAEALRQLNRLKVDDGERFFFQPCLAPVWDTAMALYALARCGAGSGEWGRAREWLLAREVRRKGGGNARRPEAEPSGWALQYRNEFYPHAGATAMALQALAESGPPAGATREAAVRRGREWLLARQSREGGWAAFDLGGRRRFPRLVAVAGRAALLDVVSPDVTGRVLEALAALGVERNHAAIRRGVEWLARSQEPDGSWYGRWGVAYIYGTCFALRGLAAAGEDEREAHVLRAGEWLRSIQNADGGWGESCASYERGRFTPAPSTPSQTAWAILGLIAGGDAGSLSVRHGIQYLVETQRGRGDWEERAATGTGVPKVFYWNHGFFGVYFPLLALGAYREAGKGRRGEA